MKPSSDKHAEWELAMGRMPTGMARAEVAKILGESSRKVSSGEISSYLFTRHASGYYFSPGRSSDIIVFNYGN